MPGFPHPTISAALRRHPRALATLGVGVTCLGIGAGVSAVANAGASTAASSASATAVKAAPRAAWRRIPGVHATVVVHTKRGFRTLTVDRGYVDSTSGDTLSVREATKTATYDTVSVTVPAGSRVRNNGRRAALSALAPGERVIVVQGLKRTIVLAHTPRS